MLASGEGQEGDEGEPCHAGSLGVAGARTKPGGCGSGAAMNRKSC